MTEFKNNKLWIHITTSAYMMAEQRGLTMQKRRFAKEIAESVISNFPSAPHLYALEQLMGANVNSDLWRDVLSIIDELLEAKNGGTMASDRDGREGESDDSQSKLGSEDGENAWRPSTPHSVDESAPR